MREGAHNSTATVRIAFVLYPSWEIKPEHELEQCSLYVGVGEVTPIKGENQVLQYGQIKRGG